MVLALVQNRQLKQRVEALEKNQEKILETPEIGPDDALNTLESGVQIGVFSP